MLWAPPCAAGRGTPAAPLRPKATQASYQPHPPRLQRKLECLRQHALGLPIERNIFCRTPVAALQQRQIITNKFQRAIGKGMAGGMLRLGWLRPAAWRYVGTSAPSPLKLKSSNPWQFGVSDRRVRRRQLLRPAGRAAWFRHLPPRARTSVRPPMCRLHVANGCHLTFKAKDLAARCKAGRTERQRVVVRSPSGACGGRGARRGPLRRRTPRPSSASVSSALPHAPGARRCAHCAPQTIRPFGSTRQNPQPGKATQAAEKLPHRPRGRAVQRADWLSM